MIGEIRWSLTPYYDVTLQKNAFKKRPALLIAKADSNDYVALPVSRVTKKHNLDPIYDIPVDPQKYPKLNLPAVSYVRTHKQTVIHIAEIAGLTGDMKKDYEDLYIEVLQKREQFSQEITNQAIK